MPALYIVIWTINIVMFSLGIYTGIILLVILYILDNLKLINNKDNKCLYIKDL
jgi:hypothetical protein